MESLRDHDARRRVEIEYKRRYWMNRMPCPNNIACPECGAELWDTRPHVVLLSNPAQTDIHCPDCDFHGYRIMSEHGERI